MIGIEIRPSSQNSIAGGNRLETRKLADILFWTVLSSLNLSCSDLL
jgi:hypothetical protein